MQKDAYQIIQYPLITEKANLDNEMRNAYHFRVAPDANKIEIRKAIEEIYAHKGIKVTKVRIINKHSKRRRFRFRKGFTPAWKKAIVFIDKQYKLELF